MITRVNEGTRTEIDVSPLDKAGAPVVPASARYRIDCRHSRTQIKDWTSVTPATTITIVIEEADNRIVNTEVPYEDREMTFEATDGGGDKALSFHQWRVVNLDGGVFT